MSLGNLVVPKHAPYYSPRGQDVHVSVPQPRRSGRCPLPYQFDVLEISPSRDLELDLAMPNSRVTFVPEAVDKAIETIDELCQFAKHQACRQAERDAIYHIKNRILYLFWYERNDLFRGVWQHTSRSNDQICWKCNGSGCRSGTLERCPKCKGSGRWKRSDRSLLTVFAIEGYQYATTWHFPNSVIKNVIQENLPVGEDLISEGKWVAADLRKIAAPMSADQYELRRSFLAWFVRRTDQEIPISRSR